MSRAVLRVLLLGGLTALSAYGQEPEVDFQHDPVEYFAARFVSVILVLGICLVLYSMVRYRGRTPSVVSWGLLFTSVMGVPVLVFLSGMPLVFERAERVEFCSSCHLAMIGYERDMKNPKSESLAAIHFKNRYIPSNQCYVCHTSYGMFGTVEAKLSGLNDLYKYYTRTYRLPIKMRHPYPNNDCLKCHAESVKWTAQHGVIKAALFKGETHCLECHGAINPAHTLSN